MARRIRGQSLIGVALLLAVAAGAFAREDPPGVLVRYSFDDDLVETGPDTFAVMEHARGSVELTSAYRFSGYHAVEIRDVAGDGDFPELQGYFPERRRGRLYAHFVLLVTEPEQALNVALAGPAGFRLAGDGIAFWLRTRDGVLEHVSDSIPKKLLLPRPLTWYRVDLAYDVSRGHYDLSIAEEDDPEPRVLLHGQPNATRRPGSSVDKFSFIGDNGSDDSDVLYYVDDVVIGTDDSVTQQPFAAPGRRKFFFERFLEYRARLDARPTCLGDARPDDFGFGPREARALLKGPLGASVRADLELKPASGSVAAGEAAAELESPTQRRVMALRLWAAGCRLLAAGDAAAALRQFESGADLAPEARRPRLAAVLALAGLGRFEDVDRRWATLESEWGTDPLYPVVMACLGLARGDPEEAERWLRGPAEAVAGLLAERNARERRMVEQYFYALLWIDRAHDAERVALAAIAGLEDAGQTVTAWVERAGDAAVFLGDHSRGLGRYEEALEADPDAPRLLLKLSDLHFLLGDDEGERELRERIYGSLRRMR
jgi:tetratricopeptide (TPR) repeat protein